MELIKTTNDVRQKYKKFIKSENVIEHNLKKTFAPISEPLKKIEKNIEETVTAFKKRKIEDNSDSESTVDNDGSSSSSSSTHNTSGQSKLLEYYFNLLATKSNLVDTTYGVYYDETSSSSYKIGSIPFIVKSNNIIDIDGLVYGATPGLLNLLFLKDPETSSYTNEDLTSYGDILINSNACRRNFDSNQQLKGGNSNKYRLIIKPLLNPKKGRKSYTGAGFMNLPKENIDYIFWDDPNEIVDRLRLLISSQSAGNNSHNNEIVSIIEEMREANIII